MQLEKKEKSRVEAGMFLDVFILIRKTQKDNSYLLAALLPSLGLFSAIHNLT